MPARVGLGKPLANLPSYPLRVVDYVHSGFAYVQKYNVILNFMFDQPILV